MIRIFFLALAILGLSSAPTATAASESTDNSSPSEKEGTELALEILSQVPSKNMVVPGFLNLRRADGTRARIPIRYATVVEGERWQETYEARGTLQAPAELLVILHQGTNSNQYFFSTNTASDTNIVHLSGDAAHIPFARSDYFLTDFGREFFHWPKQRIIKNARITMRSGRACRVLESTNPEPGKGEYLRVVSWVDSETNALIYAEAYNQKNRVFKVFSLRGLKKVNGRWQPSELELRNDDADTVTRLELEFPPDL
jgi:hypothetical protein